MVNERKTIPDPPKQENESDQKAIDESNAFANNRDLEKESKYKEYLRKENLKYSFYLLIKIFIYVGAIIFLLAAVILAWHMLAPESYQWLSDNQLTDLQKNFSSAVIAILINESAKKYL